EEADHATAADASPVMEPIDQIVLCSACGGDPAMLRKMCRRIQSLVPEDLAAVRDALHDQDALRLREAAHKLYGTLSAFSTVAGDKAADLEDLAARTQLADAAPILEQLETMAHELVKAAVGITVEALRRQEEGI